jgi:hypothetical protein
MKTVKANNCKTVITILVVTALWVPFVFAGNQEADDKISMTDPAILGWATGWQDYRVGSNVYPKWQTPEKALGQAVGDSYDIVSLGRGGTITMIFNPPIADGAGADFAVFENSFNDTFLELAWVEVSSDGVNFVRFDNYSGTLNPVDAFGRVDPTRLYQLAGKYKQGFGTLFDLNNLQYNIVDESSVLDLDNIRYVRLVDIVGDRSCVDSYGNYIYDPYPTEQSAGFDLDAVGVLNQGVLIITGDFFGDRDVDGTDLEQFLWLYTGDTYEAEADLNSDGTIDDRDIEQFAENFGKVR